MMRLRSTMAWQALILVPLLASCGGGSGDASGAGTGVTVVPAATPTPQPVSTPSPTPTAAPTPTPSPTPSPTPTASIPTAWAAGIAASYTVQPDVANCKAGTLGDNVRAEALAVINGIRALHKLPAVTYSDADQAEAMESALMMAANGQLSHTPPTSWKCYTASGAAGAGSSNLYGAVPSPYLSLTPTDTIFAGWMTEVRNIVADNVGHRRWILSPFLTSIAYGRVAGTDGANRTDATSLKVFGQASAPAVNAAALPGFVAYPQGDYPARYFDTGALLSFSAIIDTSRAGNNSAVDYAAATIRVVGEDGAALPVSSISFDNIGYGLPNNIQWKVVGLGRKVTYSVTIDNVRVRGVARSYSYTFRIVD
ncbi:uncharacterized protein YkwD [Sphingomonas sp. SORGH_AS802]|uniref:CAP domain-containing protein n=2 Tax=unclassified Sphingomonas TaxID=196159 RepID=UPI0028615034|nr:CAP domain-containing protein [Sphingomonas sp. SORGH_AS_0802]MDR6133914.1 uncharacterized protein YkwD [Sphingomonas sp. SORGH_AS_0802]